MRTEQYNDEGTQARENIRRLVLITLAMILVGMVLFPPVELVNSMSLAKSHAADAQNVASSRVALPPPASFARAARDFRERLKTGGMLGVITDLNTCYSVAEALEGHELHKTKMRECVTQDAVAFVFDRVARQSRMPEHAYLADAEFIKRFSAYLSANEVEQASAQGTLDEFRRLAAEATTSLEASRATNTPEQRPVEARRALATRALEALTPPEGPNSPS